VLQAARSANVGEMTGRATIYMGAVSSALIALGFLAQVVTHSTQLSLRSCRPCFSRGPPRAGCASGRWPLWRGTRTIPGSSPPSNQLQLGHRFNSSYPGKHRRSVRRIYSPTTRRS
jgi:hypothetical protein